MKAYTKKYFHLYYRETQNKQMWDHYATPKSKAFGMHC